jgi:tetratricopeptide (TPR) repeat protein
MPSTIADGGTHVDGVPGGGQTCLAVASGEGAAESIGQRLRRLRHERGLSQRELASPGVSYAYISRIEAGARRPSVKALRMLARKLGVSADYLETGSEIRDTDERELRIADAELGLRLAEDPGAAEERLRELRDDALAAGDAIAAARSSLALGLAAARAGHNAEAIERLESALETAPVSPSARPEVYGALGRAYVAASHPDRAVDLFEECLAEVTRDAPGDLAAQIRFSTYLGHALADRGELERAQSVLEAVLDRADEMTDPYARVRLYWSLARSSDLQGRSAAALDYIRRAIGLLVATDDTLELARAHLLNGDILISQGRAEVAGRHFDLAEQLLGANPSAEHRASLHTDRSRRSALLGDGDAAVRHATTALDAAGDELHRERGNALWALAEGLALTGDTEGANEAFGSATALLGEHGERRDYAEAYRAWGKFLRRAGREREALEVLERAADVAAEPVGTDTGVTR